MVRLVLLLLMLLAGPAAAQVWQAVPFHAELRIVLRAFRDAVFHRLLKRWYLKVRAQRRL